MITGLDLVEQMIRIAAGWHTPDWVYDSGAEPFDYIERTTDGASRMPVPWDGVFLDHWGDFLRAVGQRYISLEMLAPFEHGPPVRLPAAVEPRPPSRAVGGG